jgi:1-acyl-sn-glycerol-3-phosphate acyltransferase
MVRERREREQSKGDEPDQPSIDRGDPSIPGPFWRFCRMVARPIMTFMFDLKVYGRHHVPRRGGALLVTNHQSYLDPVLIGAYLQRPMAYLAKSELFENKHFAWLIRSLNAFPIKQGAGDVGAVKELIKRLKQGYLTGIFAEGTRTEDGELQPIQPGSALVIRRAHVPAIPCVIQGSFQAWPRQKKLFHSHPIAVMYGPPLKVEGLKGDEIVRLIDKTFHEMVAELRRIDRRLR